MTDNLAIQIEGDLIAEIQLNKGSVAIVDRVDFAELSKHKWYLTDEGYARRRKASSSQDNVKVYMHREILGDTKEYEVDHINRNPLDNRVANLRLVTRRQNSLNTGPRFGGSSRYKGVSWREKDKKWASKIESEGSHYHLGLFSCEENAALAYNQKAKELFGIYAYLNDISIQEIDTSKEVEAVYSSIYRGVHLNKYSNRWRASLNHGGKKVNLGTYGTPEEAARMYNFWAFDLLGPGTELNKIEGCA